MTSIGTIFTSTYHTKKLNPWLTHQWSFIASWGDRPFKDHLSTHGCLTSLRNQPEQMQPGQFHHQYLPELLINIYSYHVILSNFKVVIKIISTLDNRVTNHFFKLKNLWTVIFHQFIKLKHHQ